MITKLGEYFAYLSDSSVLIPLYFFIRKSNNKKDLILILLACILFVGGLTDLFSILIMTIWEKSNYILINTEFVVEIVLISNLFIRLCSPIRKKVIAGTIIFISVFFISCFYWQPIFSYQSITEVTASFLVMAYSTLYYFNLLKELPTEKPMQYPPFLIVLAFFTYFAMNLYIYALSTYVFTQMSRQDAIIFWMFHGLSEISKNILFAMAIYYASKLPGYVKA